MAKCANPLDLLLLLLPPLKEVERLPRRLRWTRRWRCLVVVVVQQTVVGHGGIVVVDVVVVGGVVVVEEIVGRAGDGFCSSQVGQEAPGEGGASAPDSSLPKSYSFSPLPQLPKGETHVFADHTPTSQQWCCTEALHANPLSHESWLAKKTLLPCFERTLQHKYA